jgi:signal transduction histidine kinase
VFLNLFSNAVQAIGNGGKVRLRVYEGTDWDTHRRGVCIAIVDTGPGIRPEDADKLFKPFFSTKSAKGTGLGLWISQGIIQKYEGKITFRTSTASGRTATCFRIFLPVGSMEQARIANAVEGTASREEALKTTNGAD